MNMQRHLLKLRFVFSWRCRTLHAPQANVLENRGLGATGQRGAHLDRGPNEGPHHRQRQKYLPSGERLPLDERDDQSRSIPHALRQLSREFVTIVDICLTHMISTVVVMYHGRTVISNDAVQDIS